MEKPAVIWKPIVWESLVGSLFKMRGETTQMRERRFEDRPKLPRLPITASSKSVSGRTTCPNYRSKFIFKLFFTFSGSTPTRVLTMSNILTLVTIIFWLLTASPVHIFAERLHLAKFRGVVVVEGVGGDPVVELLNVVRPLRTEVVDLVVVLQGDPCEDKKD